MAVPRSTIAASKTSKSRNVRRCRRQPTPRPNFQPARSGEEGIRATNQHLAPESMGNVATRLAALVLARTPEQLMRDALEEGDDGTTATEVVLNLLGEGEALLQARLEMLRAAQTRVLWSAAYAHGV
jgi:hypothetical protein